MVVKMPKKRPVKKFGWLPDIPDPRDFYYSATMHAENLPDKIDLRSKCPKEIYNQGDLGSCTANAIGCAYQFNQIKQSIKDFIPSRLFIYYNERLVLGTEDEDSGAMIRDGIKSISKEGAPPEDLWPYNINKFREEPPKSVYNAALSHQAIRYQRIYRNLTQMKSCLAEGFPFVLGFTAYESFTSPQVARTGIVEMPKNGDPIWSGHAVLAVGYDDIKKRIMCRNSWGAGWGMNGYFLLPYEYLTDTNLSGDFWTVRFVE
jgi:C1A family cysteine protease